MSYQLPPAGSDLRETFDLRDLVQRSLRHELPTLAEAKRSARETFARNRGAISSIFYAVHKADDSVWLIEIGPRGGWKKRWIFGKIPNRIPDYQA